MPVSEVKSMTGAFSFFIDDVVGVLRFFDIGVHVDDSSAGRLNGFSIISFRIEGGIVVVLDLVRYSGDMVAFRVACDSLKTSQSKALRKNSVTQTEHMLHTPRRSLRVPPSSFELESTKLYNKCIGSCENK